MQIMDTPLPSQIRPIQQEAGQATEGDVMELVEMILGALGRDALGMGSSIAHPRDSEEWKSMTAFEKLEFFAPIWRIMRDEMMTVEQVSQCMHPEMIEQASSSHTHVEMVSQCRQLWAAGSVVNCLKSGPNIVILGCCQDPRGVSTNEVCCVRGQPCRLCCSGMEHLL